MKTSAAEIIKSYLEKYIITNELKTKQNRYKDPPLAHQMLAISYSIVQKMDDLIDANQANDFTVIKTYLRQEISAARQEQRKRSTLLHWLLAKPPLPTDFARCLHEAWFDLNTFEQQFKPKSFSRR
jgi:hypothetical protein